MKNFEVDPIRFAKSLNIEVIACENLIIEGKIELKSKKTIITYNSSTDIIRQRFIIAHEIAHFLLGHLNCYTPVIEDTKENFSSENTSFIENEANLKAIEILIPKETLEYLIFELKIMNLEEISDILKVSTLALHLRLKNLNMV